MRLIGLTGAIGSGKSTVAGMLGVNHLFTEYTFKVPLVDALCSIFDVSMAVFIDRNLKTKPHEKLFGKTPREVMRSFGTDWGRNMISPDIWVKPIETLLNETQDNVVVSDVRFNNEAEMIKRNGGQIWQIFRADNPFQVETKHDSENGIDHKYIDRIVRNNGSIDDLSSKITRLVEACRTIEDYGRVVGYYGA